MQNLTNIQFGHGVLNGSECVSTAWELIKKRYGLYLGVTLLTMVISTWLSCFSWFVMGPIMAGLYHIVSRDLDNEPIEFGMMFKGFDKFVPLMIIGLIESIPQMLNFVLSMVFNVASLFIPQDGRNSSTFFQSSGASPAISGAIVVLIVAAFIVFFILWIGWVVVFYFAIPLTFEHDLGPVETIKLSARAAWANFGGIVGLGVVSFFVGLLGMLMICIGIFLVSIPITMVAYAVAYRQVFPRTERNVNFSPPPPTAYGDFGHGMA